MDFHQLRVFVEVARQKSFSRAAENIFLTQPTVSVRIKSLEDEVGTLLLDRSQRELQLTAAGKILFKYLAASGDQGRGFSRDSKRIQDHQRTFGNSLQ